MNWLIFIGLKFSTICTTFIKRIGLIVDLLKLIGSAIM